MGQKKDTQGETRDVNGGRWAQKKDTGVDSRGR